MFIIIQIYYKNLVHKNIPTLALHHFEMSHLSATQMISQLTTSNKLPQFQKQNGVIYRQPKMNYERKLSPWLGKRRYSKGSKNATNNGQLEDQKWIKSEKTQQFLKKIFPHRRNKTQAMSASHQQRQTKYKNQKNSQEEEQNYIFLPINFMSLKSSKNKQSQISIAQKKPTPIESLNRTTIRTVEPQIQLKQTQHYSHRVGETPKAVPMVLTFRRSWKKKQKCRTENIEQQSEQLEHRPKKKLSMNQIYQIIGKKQGLSSQCSFDYMRQYYCNYQDNNFESSLKYNSKQLSKESWLMPRSRMKKNKKIKTLGHSIFQI